MTNVISTLKCISGYISDYIKSKKKLCVTRTRKNDIIDAILFRLFLTQKGTTQEEVTIQINSLKNQISTTRQALAKKEKKLNVKFYENISDILLSKIQNNIKCKYTKQVIGVDGTYPTFLNSLSKDGYSSNKTCGSVTPLITGLYNVTYNIPIMLNMTKHKDERRAFMDLSMNLNKYKNNIFVFDRGYMSEELFNFMNNKELNYICRIRDNSLCIPNNDDDIIINSNGFQKRICKYTINNKCYYLATNLVNRYEYSINTLKQIYHSRWDIEEYFKYIKANMNISTNNEKRETEIKKTLFANLIVSQITFLVMNLKANKSKKDTDNNKVINKSILTKGIYDKFLFYFFKNIHFTHYFLINFFKVRIKYIKTNRDKSNPRICKRPNHLSYYKNCTKNVKSKNL